MGELQSTPDLFNLVDLIIGSLRSRSGQTVTVTLQLLSVILRRHHRYAVTTLLRTTRVLTEGPQKTIGAHQKEMNYLLSLASDIGAQEDFDESYDNHVKDATNLLESHPCSHPLIAPIGVNKPHTKQATIPGTPPDIHSHTLRPDDPVLKNLLIILSAFFTNSVETNLALTEALIDLAVCGYMNTEGWLLPDPTKYTYPTKATRPSPPNPPKPGSQAATELAHIQSLQQARRRPHLPLASTPPLLLTLHTLVSQIATYRTTIPRFPDLLRARLLAFKLDSPAPPARTDARGNRLSSESERSLSPPPSSSTTSSRTRRTAAAATFDSLASRIFPDLATRAAASPLARGRTQRARKQSIVSGSRSGVSSSPLRNSETAAATLLDEDGGTWEAMGSASQSAAFALVDRSILDRRVGVPRVAVVDGVARAAAVAVPEALRSSAASTPAGSTPAGSTVGDGEDEEGSVATGRTEETEAEVEEEEEKMVSVSHVLTNIVVLQEFILELAALVQVRAGMFGEVRFI